MFTPAIAQDYIPAPLPIEEDKDAYQYMEQSAETIDIMPAKSTIVGQNIMMSENGTHPALKLTPDKSQIIRLDRPAASVIVGNPNHVSVLSESTTTLVFVPKVPGATFVTILDKNSDVIMERHVIVGTPKEKYMRIRRSCAGEKSEDCQTTRVFYCPDTCHEVGVSRGEDGARGAGNSAPNNSSSDDNTSNTEITNNDGIEQDATN